MTLRVVCVEGHVSEYNLTIEPTICWQGSLNGGSSSLWDWSMWECKEPGCMHKEYVSHVIDDKFYVHAGEDEFNSKNKGMYMAFMLLALYLSKKAIGGI